MNIVPLFLTCLLETEEEMVNITPTLIRFCVKFLLIFGVIALVTVLTPWLAKKVDAILAKLPKKETSPEDPRCKAVKGIYDAQQPKTPDTDASDFDTEDTPSDTKDTP